MSGRKASEVSSLLNRNAETREPIWNNFDNVVSNLSDKILQDNKEYEKYMKDVKALNIDFSEAATMEFSEESRLAEEKFSNLRNLPKKKPIEVVPLLKEIDTVKKELKELDLETKRVKEKIKTSPHYCDNEYAVAEKIVASYETLNKKRENIFARLNTCSLNSKQNLVEVKNQYNKLEELRNLAKKINEKAQLRKEANSIKGHIEKELQSIDKGLADKFMKQEYCELNNQIKEFLAGNDVQVLEYFKDTETLLSKFFEALSEKHNKFIEEKEKAETYFNSIMDMKNIIKLYSPLDYSKKGEAAEKLTLEEFLREFAKGEYLDDLSEIFNKIETKLSEENFEAANVNINRLEILLKNAIAYANIKQESILKNIHLAKDLRDVMRSMNYKASAKIIDNDINNGFRVTCQVGDEIIDFDKVQVDDDGKVDLQINHLESRKNTCHKTWRELQKAFEEEGIMIKDIKWQGRSVLDRRLPVNKKDEMQKKEGLH